MPSRRGDRAPTISDVAQQARVSLPTVSRVLTGSTPVRDVTRQKVLRAIEELGYRPNAAARALVSGQQSIVGVISRNTVDHGYAQMILGAEKRAKAYGFMVAVGVVDSADEQTVVSAVDVLLGQPLVGLVILDYYTYDTEALSTHLRGVAYSTVSGLPDEADEHRVVVDDRRGARELTEHLLALGHRTVHHVSVPGSRAEPNGREVGWREALRAAGAAAPAPIPTDWSIEQAYRAGRHLARDASVTAVLCGNDRIAFAVMSALHDAGRTVPGDVSVVGMDDEEMAAVWRPALTTYRLDHQWAGAAALDKLVLASGAVPLATPPLPSPSFGVVVRGSAGAPPSL